jgi:hypothetical protein
MWSCASHGAEQLVLEQFFNASRQRDLTALQRIATVVFEPLEQGTITEFTITSVVDQPGGDGQIASKQVTVSAPVRLPAGPTARKTLSLVLQRGDGVTTAQWIVTGFVVR